MLGQAGKSSEVWSTAPQIVSIFRSWCLFPLLIPQHTHGRVELFLPSSLPAGPIIPVVDVKMPGQGHPPCGSPVWGLIPPCLLPPAHSIH